MWCLTEVTASAEFLSRLFRLVAPPAVLPAAAQPEVANQPAGWFERSAQIRQRYSLKHAAEKKGSDRQSRTRRTQLRHAQAVRHFSSLTSRIQPQLRRR